MNKTEATRFVTALVAAGNQRAAAKSLGLAQSTFSGKVNKAREVLGERGFLRLMGAQAGSYAVKVAKSVKAVETIKAAKTIDAAKVAGVSPVLADVVAHGDKTLVASKIVDEEMRRLRAQIKSLTEQALTTEKVRRQIFDIAHTKPSMPVWLSAPKASKKSIPGVPILFGSDWHWGEVVNPDEIGGVNKYNLEIAHKRLNTLIESSIDLLTNHMVNPKYPGIVFALGGDMVSGNIHEELTETNEMPIMPVVLDLVDHLIVAINRLKSVFGKVFLPCVAGNHGRGHKKPRAKESNFSSYDWLIYQSLDRYFANDPDVVFFIPDGPDALVSVYGHRYLFTHGNQFRGGDGMIGPLGPIIRGDHKKRGRNSQVGQDYDTLVLGHFHTLTQMQRVIMNGSLIGYNEYAYANNFGYEPPQQALWVTHPDHGITFSMPVHLESSSKKDAAPKPWVAFFEAKV